MQFIRRRFIIHGPILKRFYLSRFEKFEFWSPAWSPELLIPIEVAPCSSYSSLKSSSGLRRGPLFILLIIDCSRRNFLFRRLLRRHDVTPCSATSAASATGQNLSAVTA
ncbi:hypothetical protein QVD17_17708 [Tagetes erecta]|uniref:Uncharacterized protein n=1 Tax=Tagetes erecta TaxID=13708 RepID=A0AAD8P0H8_TARER|nr:hypothetical protein QVD17_17708 [Tagetes erecta]